MMLPHSRRTSIEWFSMLVAFANYFICYLAIFHTNFWVHAPLTTYPLVYIWIHCMSLDQQFYVLRSLRFHWERQWAILTTSKSQYPKITTNNIHIRFPRYKMKIFHVISSLHTCKYEKSMKCWRYEIQLESKHWMWTRGCLPKQKQKRNLRQEISNGSIESFHFT